MKPKGNEMLEAILAKGRTLNLDEVQARIAVAANDPLLQDIVDQALAPQDLTVEQRAEAREALLLRFATDPKAQHLLEEIRAGGGKSHVVEPRGAPDVTGASARRNRGAR